MQKYTPSLNLKDISRILKIEVKSVRNWCKTGKLKGYRIGNSADWYIRISDFAKFIHQNPKYKAILLDCEIPIYAGVKDDVLTILGYMPPLFSLEDVSHIFFVAPDSVRSWVKQGYLEPCEYRTTTNAWLFDLKSLKSFVCLKPSYATLYRNYIYKQEGGQRYVNANY